MLLVDNNQYLKLKSVPLVEKIEGLLNHLNLKLHTHIILDCPQIQPFLRYNWPKIVLLKIRNQIIIKFIKPNKYFLLDLEESLKHL
jgi:hypothetical protein